MTSPPVIGFQFKELILHSLLLHNVNSLVYFILLQIKINL